MWITRFGAVLASACCWGCAHRAGDPAVPLPAEATQTRAAQAAEELERTGIDAFDAYVMALAASEDPLDAIAASLLADVVAHAQHDDAAIGPTVVGFVDSKSPAARALADAIAIGLRRHPAFRVSDRLAFDAVDTEQHHERSGAFADDSLPSAGAFQGLSAIGRVTIERVNGRSAITLRISSMRTLLVLADARVTTDAALPEDATTEMLRRAFPIARAAESPPPPECREDPKSVACRKAILRQVIQTVREVQEELRDP